MVTTLQEINLNQGIHLKTDHSKTFLCNDTKEVDSGQSHLPLTSNKNERWILACVSSQPRDYTFLLWLLPWRGSSILFVSSQTLILGISVLPGWAGSGRFNTLLLEKGRAELHGRFHNHAHVQNTLLGRSTLLFALLSLKLSTKGDITAFMCARAGNEENDKQFHVQRMHR